MALERLRQHEEAAADYSAVLQLDPLNAPAWQNRGTLWLRLGRLHEAVHDLGRAVALDGCAAAAWHARGEAHERLGQGDAALADLQRWGQLWAGCSGRCRAGVPTRWKSRCHQRAKVFFVFFLKHQRGHVSWHWHWLLSAVRRRVSPCIKCSHPSHPACACRACSLEPSNPTFLRSLGLALRSCGRHEQAVSALSQLLEVQPDDEAALQARG